MSNGLERPLLFTPDHDFLAATVQSSSGGREPSKCTVDLQRVYEIKRTVQEIKTGEWKRIALQFPDDMLRDAAAVFEALNSGLQEAALKRRGEATATDNEDSGAIRGSASNGPDIEKLYILGDTSYGACCVDEIAAEHVDADVIVHYGRTCLSPAARLPVIYIYTEQRLPQDLVLQALRSAFPDSSKEIILMADVMYTNDVREIAAILTKEGYSNVFPATPAQDTSSPLPNRMLPRDVQNDPSRLLSYSIVHILQPHPSLLLSLASRTASIYVLHAEDVSPSQAWTCTPATTSIALRRRYGLLISLARASIFGILVNTLSVKNYLHMVEQVKRQIGEVGKKSYTFVVGKVNAAKLANFSEVDGWVVIGCSESSLIDSKDFFRPVITPFELELALKPDHERVWTGQWSSNFHDVLRHLDSSLAGHSTATDIGKEGAEEPADHSCDSEPESAPPDFDLRTGRALVPSRLMRPSGRSSVPSTATTQESLALVHKPAGTVASIGGQMSPGAVFLSKRTWRGLGSDLEIAHDDEGTALETTGAQIEEGRSGIARGYQVGEDGLRT
ncbi:MAG: Diphthamide biosynthesis protein 2 [Lichina confinis]|nr:MAG: Diphthamide biosynthesis protein 2 [Lichina confinis]